MPRIRRGRAVFLLVGPLAAGFSALTWASYKREIRQERERVSTGSRIARTPCGPIEYAVAGDGPPVLLVHGAGGGSDQGLECGAPLARSGLRVIAMSRFGYLRTPLPPDASAAAQADAPSAMQFALRHPDRCSALVLMVPAVYVPRAGGAPPMKTPAGTRFLFDTALKSDFFFWAAIRLARPVLSRAILATPPEVVKNADAGEQARVGGLLRHILPVSARRLGLLNDAAVTSLLPRYELERIAVPTLVIIMADDLFGTCDGALYTAEHVPGARFIGYPTGGHVWAGHQEEIVAEVGAFLSGGDSQKSIVDSR